MAQYELSRKLSKYLDRHLIFPLLEFLQDKGIYAEDDILKAKIALLQKTNMVDFAMDIHKDLYQTEEVPPEMAERRSQVVAQLRTLHKAVDPIIACLSNPNVIRNFRQDRSFNLQLLKDEFDIGPEQVDALYQYAKFQFDCGNYSSASELLQAYRPLVTTSERNLSVLWGKLAADILMVDYDAATEDITRLREAIDNAPFLTPLMQLQQRTWLMHWSLHVYWNHENGKNALVDLFLQQPFTSAITVNAQHLLRYLAAAVIVNKRRRGNALKELIRLVQTVRRARRGAGGARGTASFDARPPPGLHPHTCVPMACCFDIRRFRPAHSTPIGPCRSPTSTATPSHSLWSACSCATTLTARRPSSPSARPSSTQTTS